MDVVECVSNKETVDVFQQKWVLFTANFDYKLTKVEFPSDYSLYMVDVNAGSDTKVLVKQVLEWDK